MRKKVKISVITAIVGSLLLGSTMSFAVDDSGLSDQALTPVIYGDVNGDKSVDALDAALLKSYLLNGGEAFNSQYSFKASDVNGDEEVNSLDLSLIKQYLLGAIKSFPVESLETWVPYMPEKDDIQYHIEQNSDGKYQIVFEVTFPSSGYKVEYSDELAIALGIEPDGTILTSFRPVEEPAFWEYAGPSLTVMTTKRIVYTLRGEGKYTFEFLGTWYNFSI